jgi:HEAT repeat protein
MFGKVSDSIFTAVKKISMKKFAVSAGLIIFAVFDISCMNLQVVETETDLDVTAKAETLYQSPLWTDRVHAIDLVSGINSEKAETLLVKASGDEYSRVRIESLDSLAKFKTLKAFEAVKNCAENETEKSVKWTAIKSLAQFQNPLAAPIFIQALTHDDWLIREEAIRGLLAIHDSATEKLSVDIILRTLLDPSENVRIAALSNMRVGNPVIYSVIKIQISDVKNRSRFTYLKALLTALLNFKLDDNVRKIVVTLITHPNSEIRVLALRCVKSSDERIRLKE